MNSIDAQEGAEAEIGDQTNPESKSERKRKAQALQQLGLRLAGLKPDVLAQFELPDVLHHAIKEYNRFKSNEARRRQLQFIGKQMRQIDVTPIQQKLDVVDGQAATVRQELHQLEQWRERLLADNQALTQFIEAYPHVDRQALRNLVRKTRQATEQDKAANTQVNTQTNNQGKALLRYLREVIQQAT